MRQFILGTDWWTDCDDAVAIRLMARAHKRGDIDLLGIAINACMEYSAKSLEAYLRTEGITDMPIGLDSDAMDFGRMPKYQKRLSELPSRFSGNADAEDALRLYRRLLANADGQVEIAEIGYPQVLAALIESPADDISDKTGMELIKEKVKCFWMMAGKWDEQGGRENNFCRNERASRAAAIVCEKCPVPITFLGWEVGHSVITGGKLPEGDVLKQVIRDWGSENGRSSWDPMLVQLALTENVEQAGYSAVYGKASIEAETGKNYFEKDENGNRRYVIKEKEDGWYEELINTLIQ